MAISITNITTPGSAASTSLSIPYPAAIAIGEVTWMRITCPGMATETVTTPITGWNLADNQHDTSAAGEYLFWQPSDPANVGNNQAATNSNAAKTWRYQMWQMAGVRTFPQPWANLLGGVSTLGTSYTTGALTIYPSNGSGKKYMMAVAQAGATGFTHSAETATGFTSPTASELVDNNGYLLELITAPTSTATSTFSETMSGSNRAAWTILDLVEAGSLITDDRRTRRNSLLRR